MKRDDNCLLVSEPVHTLRHFAYQYGAKRHNHNARIVRGHSVFDASKIISDTKTLTLCVAATLAVPRILL